MLVIINIGNKVMYPGQGPCLIGSVVKKEVAGNPMSFYRLVLLGDSGGELFVPLEKAPTLGLRPLLNPSEIPSLMARLTTPAQAHKDWKQRAQDHTKLLSSGSAFDLAEVVASLTELNERKPLSTREAQVLDRAKRLLICEVSEVQNETKSEAEARINRALSARVAAPAGASALLQLEKESEKEPEKESENEIDG
ncbi:MAG: CarD family transcriptional regulator [Blastocatellia bacterium]|nr:CarD family transcriptional regulator [Blastocatellia bacterium]